MKFSYYTIIGRDPFMIDEHLDNVVNHAGFSKLECEKELIVIQYKNNRIPESVSEEIQNICVNKYGATVHVFHEPDNVFLTNLYACFNKGYEVADEGLVFRGGSDQIFSKDSFVHMYDAYIGLEDKNTILQANTIEYVGRAHNSRHITADFGFTFDNVDYDAFDKKVDEINKGVDKKLLTINEALRIWGKPTRFNSSLGIIDRTDGCSWLMTKDDWIKYGPMPPIENGITGDVVIHDRMQRAGYNNLIVRDCVTYHFVKGESSCL